MDVLSVGQKNVIKNWVILCVCTSAVFVLSCFAVAYVLRTTGVHTWANAQFALHDLERALAAYQSETGDIPPIGLVESQIQAAWKNGADALAEDYDGRLWIAFAVADNNRLRLWGSPPRVTRRSGLPAYGFYLEGEDGISRSGGEDPDDINSWSFESTSFYYDRLQRRQWVRNGSWSIIPATLAFVAGWVFFIRRPNKPNKAWVDNPLPRRKSEIES